MIGLGEFFLDFLYNFEDIRFAIVITICTDAQVDLVGTLVVIKGDGSAKDGVRRSHRNVLEEVAGGNRL